MLTRRKLFLLTIVFLTQFLVACGFQLRGSYEFPPGFERVYVESRDSTQVLVSTLTQALDSSSSVVVQEPADATAVLRIISSSFKQRTLSFDSRGRPREYELSYIVEFEVTTNVGENLPRQTISLKREYEFDGVDVGAGSNQRETIRNDLQANMARSILRRIAAKA